MRASAKSLSLVSCLLGAASLLGGAASAQEFSADLVTTTTQGHRAAESGKINVDKDVVRIESPGFQNGRFLVDVSAGSAICLLPARHIFMDAKQSSPLTQLLVRVDPNDPCRTWQKMAQVAGAADQGGQWRCEGLVRKPLAGAP
jgi:hypothetical protein